MYELNIDIGYKAYCDASYIKHKSYYDDHVIGVDISIKQVVVFFYFFYKMCYSRKYK